MAEQHVDPPATTIANDTLNEDGHRFLHLGDMESYLRDETYNALQSTFSMAGRGRRPACPLVSSTNKLILQLDLLRREQGSRLEDMTLWYRKLFPDVDVTLGRLQHRIQSVQKSALGVYLKDTEAFLSTTVNFDEVSPFLSELSLSRNILLSSPENFTPLPESKMTNNVILALDIFRSREGLPVSFLTRWVTRIFIDCPFSESSLRNKISKTLGMIKKLKSSRSKNLQCFLSENFHCLNPSNVTGAGDGTNARSENQMKMKEVTNAGNKKGMINENYEMKQLKETVKQLNCIQKETSLHVEALTEERKRLMQDKDDLKDQLKTMTKDLKDKIKDVVQKSTENKELKERVKLLEEEARKHSASKTYYWNSVLRKKLEEETENLRIAQEKYEILKEEEKGKDVEIVSLKAKIKNEQIIKSKLKKKLEVEKSVTEALLYTLNCTTGSDETKKELKLKECKYNRFTNDVRLAYMALQSEGNVAAHNSSKVVQIIGKYIFGQDISMTDLPSATTALTFADEAHHVAKQQVVEGMRKSHHFTYALDGTSRQKRTFIERHIILDNKKVMSIGFVEIATDDAKTLLEQSIAMFQELTEIYCSGTHDSAQPDDILKELICKLKCIMSDRAAVMKSFDEKMANFKKELLNDDDASTHFLFCNAHFLLGLAAAAKQGLHSTEKELIEEGGALGRDASVTFSRFAGCKENAASRLIRTAAEVFGPRGDEKNGCRQFWLAYCHKMNITSRFTSFRDNRFNNLFENAEAIIFHRTHMSDFLESFIPHSNLKLQSILLDLKDVRVVSEVVALAVVQVLLTGPYWGLMNSTLPYGGFPKLVQSMDQDVNKWREEGFTTESDPVFKDFSVKDDIIKECLASEDCTSGIVQSVFKNLMNEFSIVLKRQLKDFLPGGVYGGDILPEVQEILNTCPLTNLTGERLFGDLDHDMSRRRNASTFNRSAVNMWKHNATAEWIAKKDHTHRNLIMEAGRKNGKELRKKHKATVDAVREQQKVKLEETERKKKEKEIDQAEKEADLLGKIITMGGLMTTKDELDHLYRTGKLADLKAQIQYRKIFMKQSDLKVSGTMKTLYHRLLRKINGGCSSEDEEPPKKRLCSTPTVSSISSYSSKSSESDSELTSNISSLSDCENDFED